MIRDHTVVACSEVYNKSIIETLTRLSGESVYSPSQLEMKWNKINKKNISNQVG